MFTSLLVLVMTLEETGMVWFWELNPPSPSISDVRSLIARGGEWKDSLPQGKALAVVVTASGHRPRLIPFAGCSESAQQAWNFGRWSLGLTGPALLLPEGPAGATML
jgi:hypothetical protein